MLIAKYQTIGREVYESEMGPTIGYDDIREGYLIARDEDMLADWWADGEYRRLDVLAEIETIGL